MSDDMMARMEGCFYTIFTPYNADYSVDYESIEKYLTTLYRQGARKFYAMAYNSRYSQLTHPEIMQLNEFCIRTVKKLDPRNIAIVGDPIHCSTAESIEFSRHARETGADMISLIMREKYFTDQQVLDHFAEVGRVSRSSRSWCMRCRSCRAMTAPRCIGRCRCSRRYLRFLKLSP